MAAHLVGTSGFASPSLRDYLPSPSGAAMDLLSAYGGRFSSVEMESTFQRAPSRDTVAGWSRATPDGFGFTVRVPKLVTHGDELSDPARVRALVDDLGCLEGRLKCLLFTLPPTFECDPHRLEHALDALPFGLRSAWEFRHPSWISSDVMEMLCDHDAAPVSVDNLDGAPGAEFLPGGTFEGNWDFPFAYVRFRRETYSIAELMHWGALLGGLSARDRDVYAFFRQSPEATSYVLALTELLDEAAHEVQRPGGIPSAG